MRRPIAIVEYDTRWPILYEMEKERILGAIGDVTVAIEHIGSTAVPELGAKPIVDIMVGVLDLAVAPQCIEPLQDLGYEHMFSQPDWSHFSKPEYHVHMHVEGSDAWEENLLLRDYLRAHPDVAHQYQQVKRELAAKHLFNLPMSTPKLHSSRAWLKGLASGEVNDSWSRPADSESWSSIEPQPASLHRHHEHVAATAVCRVERYPAPGGIRQWVRMWVLSGERTPVCAMAGDDLYSRLFIIVVEPQQQVGAQVTVQDEGRAPRGSGQMPVMVGSMKAILPHRLACTIGHAHIPATFGAATVIEHTFPVPCPGGMNLEATLVPRRQLGQLFSGETKRPDAVGDTVATGPETRWKVTIDQQEIGVCGTVQDVATTDTRLLVNRGNVAAAQRHLHQTQFDVAV